MNDKQLTIILSTDEYYALLFAAEEVIQRKTNLLKDFGDGEEYSSVWQARKNLEHLQSAKQKLEEAWKTAGYAK